MISPKYTEVLCNIVNSGIDIFDFDYPIYNAAHKTELEDKIINHYYFYEIGSETVGRFKHNLKSVMNEIMPKYNLLYEKLPYLDILTNTLLNENASENDITTVTEDNKVINDLQKNETVNLESTSVTDRDSSLISDITITEKFSDTPQGEVTVLNNNYLTNIKSNVTDNDTTEDIDETLTLSSTNTNQVLDTGEVNEDKLKHQNTDLTRTGSHSGYNGITPTEMINQFVKNYNDVDMLIINELSVLFMRIF